jgi:DNA-binding IclR family transcriptional regulator
MPEIGKEAKNTVKSVESAFKIINKLKDLNGARLSELSEHIDKPKSSIHNYLATLEQEEYIIKQGNEYHVGLRFLTLGSFARQRQGIYDIAKPEAKSLAEKTGELTNVMAEEHGRGVYVFRATGENAVSVDATTGDRVYLHNTALGKAMLAFFPQSYVEEILETHGMPKTTENTITDKKELFQHLEKIRDRGLAIDDEERVEGLRCIAAPITHKDRAVGAISISGPTSSMKGDRFEEEIPQLISDAANVIELNLAYS